MSNSVLLDKSKALALDIIRLCNEVKTNKKESILTNQLVRSGTSVGANIREASYAHSKDACFYAIPAKGHVIPALPELGGQ